jgi:ubiquitin carboxyl-terminal hydrolase 6/32
MHFVWFYLQIVHLKRFQFVNGKWVKSQKVVNFPFNDFDPTAYLSSVPKHTVVRHRELERLTVEGRDGDVIHSTSPPLNGGQEAIIAPDSNSEAIKVDNEKMEADLSSPRKHLGIMRRCSVFLQM